MAHDAAGRRYARYDTIWRQMARWLARGATEPVAITSAAASSPGVSDVVAVLVRDRDFAPVRDAEVRLTIVEPGGGERQASATLADATDGRYTASVRFDDTGVYRIRADARRGGEALGSAEQRGAVGRGGSRDGRSAA